MEPETDLIAPVSLVIIRSGFSGTATIFWRVLSFDPDFDRSSDIVGTAGQIIIPSGQHIYKNSVIIAVTGSNNATLTLAIQADDVPEIDETFRVELLSVSEVTQQISPTEVTTFCEQLL